VEKLFAKIGQQHLLIENQDAAYAQLLGILAGVVCGEIDRARVMVNLTDKSWAVAGPGERPAAPATINGLPVVVLAPVPEPIVGDEPLQEK